MTAELDRDGRVLPFRRRPFAAKRRRRSLWLMMLSGFAGALLVVGLPFGLVVWLLTTPRFALRRVEIAGATRVSTAWAQEALRPLAGNNLLTLPIAQVRAVLAKQPWIESVEVRKHLPDRLVVTLSERQPAALMREGGDLWYLDGQGLRIAPFSPADGAVDLLLVSRSSDVDVEPARALALALEIKQAQPEWAAKLSEIEVLGDEDYCLYTAALPFPLLVRAGTVADRGRSLAAVLPEIVRRYPRVSSVDLRFERRIVIQPAVASGNAPGQPGEAPPAAAPAPARTAA